MPKKSDMAERYAAAHARREQRRRQAATRDYLPLPEERPLAAAESRPVEAGQASVATAAFRLPSIDYSYLRGDLVRTAALAAILFAIMIILALVAHL